MLCFRRYNTNTHTHTHTHIYIYICYYTTGGPLSNSSFTLNETCFLKPVSSSCEQPVFSKRTYLSCAQFPFTSRSFIQFEHGAVKVASLQDLSETESIRLFNCTRLGYRFSGLRKDYGKRYVRDTSLVMGLYQTIIVPGRDKTYVW